VEKKKLLRLLIAMVALCAPLFAGEDLLVSQKVISQKSLQEANTLIHEANCNAKREETRAAEILQSSNGDNSNTLKNYDWFKELPLVPSPALKHLESEEAELYIFTSLSMPKPLLIRLAMDAKTYRATLVLRGLKHNSYQETALYVQDLIQETSVGFIIDPTLFKKYAVNRVPDFVLSTPSSASYDKVSGNVSLRFALETMAQKGDLKAAANRLLKGTTK
jgi:conjugal transfer pilus assembly protein TrbC